MKTTYTKEEIADQEKKEYELPLLAVENDVTFDVDSCRYADRIVKGRPTLVVNTRLSVAMGHDGLNEPGAAVDDARFFPLNDDGEIDETDSAYGRNIGSIRKIAFAAFGGKNSKEPGRYPTDDNGDFYAPWVALEQFQAETGQIVLNVTEYAKPDGTQYRNLKQIRPKE